MKKIKSILLTVLGQEQYLKLTSALFFLYFKNGWLRKKTIYNSHYFIENLIKPRQTVIDIGANLGYFSVLFAKLIGHAGKVYSVEPIELYRGILEKNTSKFSQVTILPYALGESETVIKMGNPGSDKHRHGLMRVLSDKDATAETQVYEVPMKNPATLFADLDSIDYIKCDIEGYEVPVIPLMKDLIAAHKPILQIETEGENRKILFDMLNNLQYRMFYVEGNKLHRYSNPENHLPGDMICISVDRLHNFESFIQIATTS